MSDLSYLETISHKELHAKCLEYGLPNIPVTDTSRKVILRRLRATILGTQDKNTAASNIRRKTVHSSKATPAAAINSKESRVADKIPSRNNNKNNVRRTIATTPKEYYPLDNSSVRSIETTTTVSDVGSQSEDDDFYQLNTPRTKLQQSQDTRQRRSVSLSKSGVLTTSYTREIQQPHYEEDQDEEPEEEPQSYTYQRPMVTTAPIHKLPVSQPRVERSYRPELNFTQTHLNSTSYTEAPNEFNELGIQQASRNTYSGSAAPFNTGIATTSAIRQRQSNGESGFTRGRLLQPTYKVNTLYPQLNDFYDQHNNSIEPMDIETDSESESEIHRQPQQQPQQQYHHQQQRSSGNNQDSPYLSHFSRELDARKRSSPLARPQMRTTIQQQEANTPIQKFRELMIALNRTYNLKFYFLLALAVLLATLIYVIVTPAV